MFYNFFADRADKIAILDYIFKETDLLLFDLGSAYGQTICEYKNADEIVQKFELKNGNKFAITFQMHSPRFGGEVLFRKVELDPKRCNGHTFRYSTDGWGLIQLYFGGVKNNNLNLSTIQHLNEKRALLNEPFNSFNGKVSDWDWPVIEQTSRKLKYQIHNKMSVRNIGSVGILPGAAKLQEEGVQLR